MEDRRSLILRAIVESFIDTAEPVGSAFLIETYGFGVSSATIRNDMAWLEKEGFISQPHTSAGRVPTDTGFRKFVDEMDVPQSTFRLPAPLEAKFHKLEQLLAKDAQARAEEKIYYAVSVLARLTNNIAFATLPWRGSAYYMGLANVLKAPEFMHDAVRASAVIEVLEDKEHFIDFLQSLTIGKEVAVYIGTENVLKEMDSCALIATQYTADDAAFTGIIGVLGPKRMNYRLVIPAVNAVRNDIE